MMTKLKGLLYGKYVKQLFITSLVSCFILLGSSFVNSEWIFHDANESFSVPNASAFTLRVASSSAGVLDGGGMSSPKPLIMLQSNVDSSRQYRYLYFWGTDNKLYAYGNSAGTPGNSSDYEYLKFDTFYRFSNTGFVNCTYSTLHSCSYTEAVSSESFYSDTSLKGSMTRFAYYFNNSTNNYTTFCWVYDNLGFSICVKPSGASTTKLTPVAGLSIDPVEFNSDLIGLSPRIDNVKPDIPGSGNLEDDSGIIFYSDNNQIYYDTFKAIGFHEDLCYSNFELTDTVDIHTAYYDMFPTPSSGTGASILDLYENWGFYPRNPFFSYYSWYSSRYNQLNDSSDKGTMFIMSLYSGVSIGNYYIFNKLYNNEFIDTYILSYKDYYCFCDMAVNGYDPDDMNHCSLSSSFKNIFSNPGIRNGESIGDDGEFILSGSDAFGYFEGGADVFDVFNRLYTNVKHAFRIDNSLSGTSGLLPRYIILGFFLFVLLYLLKR